MNKENASKQLHLENGKWQPVAMNLTGEAGKRVLNAAVQRVLQSHAKEIKALADK